MSEKEAPTDKITEDATEEEPVEAPVEEAPAAKAPEADDDELIEEEKGKKDSKKRGKLTVLQAAVLETIRERPQRPRAIQTIIRGTGGVDVPRNEIIRSLNELRDKGLVAKISTKAWQAK